MGLEQSLGLTDASADYGVHGWLRGSFSILGDTNTEIERRSGRSHWVIWFDPGSHLVSRRVLPGGRVISKDAFCLNVSYRSVETMGSVAQWLEHEPRFSLFACSAGR